MFKEGICPCCHEKIQVPEDRDQIICMFCGKEISVEEALEKQKSKIRKVSQEEYDQYMDTAKAVLEKLIRECDNPMQNFRKKIATDFAFMSWAPTVFISAKTGIRIDNLFTLINTVAANNAMRVRTGVLNELLAQATTRVQPPTDKGKRLKIFYMTQASTKPPTFVSFCNKAELFHF